MYRQHYPNDPGMHNVPPVYTRSSPPRTGSGGSFCEKVKKSLVAIVVGFVILAVASGLIFWNEGRSVQTAQSLEEGLRAVRSLKTTEVVFDENNGKLVHVSGALKTSKVLFDEDYSVAVPAVKLRRKVEMYQWVESESKREIHDGDTVSEEVSYSYSQQWRSELIRSDSFNNRLHINPDKIPIEARLFIVEDAQIGNFFLSKSLVEKITNFRELHPNDPPRNINARLYQGYFYHGYDPQYPQIGDIRVMFEYAGLSSKDTSRLGPADKVSILSRQSNNQLQPYETTSGDELELLYPGEHSAEYMISREHMTNTLVLWALRFVGWLLMFIGFGCIASFLVAIVDWVPMIREIVVLGTTALSMVLSISLSLTVIALGWIWFRPYLGAFILVLALSPLIVSRLRYRPTTLRSQ